MEREDSPDLDGVGYIEEDHPLRPSLAAQSIALLQVRVPDRSVSMSSSLADQDAPMFPRETTYRPVGHQGLNGRLVFAIAAAAFGSSFQHGYNTGVVNAPQKLIEEFIRSVIANRTDGAIVPADVSQSTVTMIWAMAVSIFCVGGMIGGSLVGFVANRFGRKGGLLLNNFFVFASAILQEIFEPMTREPFCSETEWF